MRLASLQRRIVRFRFRLFEMEDVSNEIHQIFKEAKSLPRWLGKTAQM